MPCLEDLRADVREDLAFEHLLCAYEEACEAGFDGTLDDFRMSPPRTPSMVEFGELDINF